MSEIEVNFYDTVPDDKLKFAVIVACYNGKYVWCKHKQRDTYEIAGGHRENGESITEAAKRELYEETGAVEFKIKPVCVYSVCGKTQVNSIGDETFGMLFVADIAELENELYSEIEHIGLFDGVPHRLTYPLIQPLLFEKAKYF